MKFLQCVEQCSTFIDLKRVANAYVIDYKKLSEEDLKKAIIKTAPQYYHYENVLNSFESAMLNPSRDIRNISLILLKLLLNKDDFILPQRALEDEIIQYEQTIIDQANEFDDKNITDSMSLFKFILEVAWEHNNDISVDEQNLIIKLKDKLKISDTEYEILEAKLGKYPTIGNILHTKTAIGETRKYLQSAGLLFPIRDGKNINYDAIPEEIVSIIRNIMGIEIKEYAYRQLLTSKFVKDKTYLCETLNKAKISYPNNITLSALLDLVFKSIKPSNLLGGFSPRDGLDIKTLGAWCQSINISGSGSKSDLIQKILNYYDDIKQFEKNDKDERANYFEYYEELASRNLDVLRKQNIISKDLECEHHFEEATNYLFEKLLKNKPLLLKGSDHPDGMLSFNDKLILWDNKSKETEVNLGDHIKQFDRYIKSAEKPVSVFLVIGPSFTKESSKECLAYGLSNDTLILLITAKELKEIAVRWNEKFGNEEKIFPLNYFKQNGRFNDSILEF